MYAYCRPAPGPRERGEGREGGRGGERGGEVGARHLAHAREELAELEEREFVWVLLRVRGCAHHDILDQ